MGSRGASSEGAPSREVAGGQARGCMVVFGSKELWAGQTPGAGAATREEAVKPQPHPQSPTWRIILSTIGLQVRRGWDYGSPAKPPTSFPGAHDPPRAKRLAQGDVGCPLLPSLHQWTFAGHTPVPGTAASPEDTKAQRA